MRVLIIGVSGDGAAKLTAFLEANGHDVEAAGDAFTGMQMVLANRYDAIVLDLMLPEMGGVKFGRKLIEIGCEGIPIMMVSANALLAGEVVGMQAGEEEDEEVFLSVSRYCKNRFPFQHCIRRISLAGNDLSLHNRDEYVVEEVAHCRDCCMTALWSVDPTELIASTEISPRDSQRGFQHAASGT